MKRPQEERQNVVFIEKKKVPGRVLVFVYALVPLSW
jgi:hypothetical protein